MAVKSKLPLGTTTVFNESDASGMPSASVGRSSTGVANGGSHDEQPSLTYDELQDFANVSQAPADDISRMRDKDGPDGESDVNDELLSNPPASNGSTPGNGSSLSLKSRTTPPWGDGSFYDWYAKQLEPYKPLSAEELEKERKRQKRKELFAAIGDGLSALSNIFFTTQGAPNMDDGKNTLSAAAQARYDKMKAEREANNKYYMNGWWNIWKQQQADAATQRSAEYQRRSLELREKQEDRLDKQEETNRIKTAMWAEMDELRGRYAAGAIDKAAYDKGIMDIYRKYHGKGETEYTNRMRWTPRGWEPSEQTKTYDKEAANRSVDRINEQIRGNRANAGGGKSGGESPAARSGGGGKPAKRKSKTTL